LLIVKFQVGLLLSQWWPESGVRVTNCWDDEIFVNLPRSVWFGFSHNQLPSLWHFMEALDGVMQPIHSSS
jgi:hypothetical protein